MILKSDDLKVLPLSRMTLLWWGLASFLATYAAPFGTFAYPVQSRALFWTIIVVGSTLIARGALRTVWYFLPGRTGLIVDLCVGTMMVLFFTPLLSVSASVLFRAHGESGSSYSTYLQYVAIISVAVCITRRMISRILGPGWLGEAEPVPQDISESDHPRLIRRLPLGFSGPILRLTVEDHFVDVVAECGTYRIRLRFADAVNEMEPCEGFCTHRSHWVAANAVAGVRREAGKIWLEIINGDLVPVSRKYRPNVEEAGLL